jgi:hypothetical protein
MRSNVVTDILVKRDDRLQPDSRSIYHIQTTTIQQTTNAILRRKTHKKQIIGRTKNSTITT